MAKKVTPSELREWLRTAPESVAIIDVRDDDHHGGHIVGSKNYPSHKFADNLPTIIEQTKEKERIVFHCSLSQQRGPKASRMFAEARKLIGERTSNGPEVYILEGGFVNWHAHGYAKDPQLTAAYDAEHWKYGFQG